MVDKVLGNNIIIVKLHSVERGGGGGGGGEEGAHVWRIALYTSSPNVIYCVLRARPTLNILHYTGRVRHFFVFPRPTRRG